MEGSDPEYVECIVTEGGVIVYTGATLTSVTVSTIKIMMTVWISSQ